MLFRTQIGYNEVILWYKCHLTPLWPPNCHQPPRPNMTPQGAIHANPRPPKHPSDLRDIIPTPFDRHLPQNERLGRLWLCFHVHVHFARRVLADRAKSKLPMSGVDWRGVHGHLASLKKIFKNPATCLTGETFSCVFPRDRGSSDQDVVHQTSLQ